MKSIGKSKHSTSLTAPKSGIEQSEWVLPILNSELALRKVNLSIVEFALMTLSSQSAATVKPVKKILQKRGEKNLNVIVVPIITTGSMTSSVFHFGYEILLKIFLIYIKYFWCIYQKFCSWKNKINEGMVRFWRDWQTQEWEIKDNIG